ncbi:hypothetical protein CYMTET_31470 [Cymbomonas tetramitiformis]|uniref:EF-hand domain-containing protein n=1 Tax=Cymbomonas tetramitiformis TaxID=36881 RepID=A0AAE0FHT2_9CHLO|nr:hypothetical protein CYMTET_31470 [Cymbomonas tetramitiformis]
MLKLAYPLADREDVAKLVDVVTPKVVEMEEDEKLALEEKYIQEMWRFWDLDGNGELDEFEVKAVLREIGASNADAKEFFLQMDTDNSGAVSKDEFKDWWIGRGKFANISKSYLNYEIDQNVEIHM